MSDFWFIVLAVIGGTICLMLLGAWSVFNQRLRARHDAEWQEWRESQRRDQNRDRR